MNLGSKNAQSSKQQEKPKVQKNEEKQKNLFKSSNENNTKVEDSESDINSKKSKSGMFVIGGIILGIVVVIVILIILITSGGNKQDDVPIQNTQTTQQATQQAEQPQNSGQSTQQQGSTSNSTTDKKDVGFQDFTGDTNMQTSTTLDDPDSALKDIYGLSVRVDYNVADIDYVTDFVNYEKHRGTWGGGLELYWLEATYKDIPYIIQIPFTYYKELDDIGIVPVKMEVLRINVTGSSEGSERTIVSFMELDEATLKQLLKNKK